MMTLTYYAAKEIVDVVEKGQILVLRSNLCLRNVLASSLREEYSSFRVVLQMPHNSALSLCVPVIVITAKNNGHYAK